MLTINKIFFAAFLLMAFSFIMHQRSNAEVLGELQHSVTAIQEVQAVQDENLKLKEQLEAMEKELDKANSDLELSAKTEQAMLYLSALQQSYAVGDLESCKSILAAMDAEALAEALPQNPKNDLPAPASIYQQLRDAVLNK